jgi:hypothetical protein
VEDDALAFPHPSGARDCDVDVAELPVCAGVQQPADTAVNPPEFARTQMAEDGAFPTRKHRRHPSASLAEPCVADPINTTMKGMESMGPDAAVDSCF